MLVLGRKANVVQRLLEAFHFLCMHVCVVCVAYVFVCARCVYACLNVCAHKNSGADSDTELLIMCGAAREENPGKRSTDLRFHLSFEGQVVDVLTSHEGKLISAVLVGLAQAESKKRKSRHVWQKRKSKHV